MLRVLYLSQIANPFPQVTAGSSTNFFINVLNIVFTVVGAVALLFIVIGGFKFVVSTGDPSSAAKARNTVIYAAVGLIITLSASLIVNFVFGNL